MTGIRCTAVVSSGTEKTECCGTTDENLQGVSLHWLKSTGNLPWLLPPLTHLLSEARVAGCLENKTTVLYYHTPAVVLSALQNLLEIVWRIFKVSFQYFSIHLHSHSATQRFAETAAGSGGSIERSHEMQPGFCKERIFSSSAPFLWTILTALGTLYTGNSSESIWLNIYVYISQGLLYNARI